MQISQSLIKAYYDYAMDGSAVCGLQFKAKYLDKDKRFDVSSDAMKLGMYFEYLATGSLPKSGVVPEPEKAYAGTAREKLAAPYERAMKSAELFKKVIEAYGIKILEVGKHIGNDDIHGTIDIFALWDGKEVIIDLKYTGLIEDKWHEMGWNAATLSNKDSIMIQGVHYKLLAYDILGIEDIPFYYFVFDASDSDNMRIIYQNVDESRTSSHRIVIENTRRGIQNSLRAGFKPRPSLKNCKYCPLNHECPHATTLPVIERVDY